ncbi:hypothetical protein I4F81_000826 [Pyropia yezoensis]|uniref:Uncharacterized protein n=1 Tax=Pyropia yezoensis TaxID=2788 RepID=A0ACC3BKD7_PYRYE|nr:hypothetical protein I4F81_000826 [Neopyropia yezoensis]
MAHLRLLPAERSAHRPLSAQAPLRAHHELLPTWPLGDDVNDGKLWDDEEPMSSASLLDAVASGAAAAAKRVSGDAVTARLNADETATAASGSIDTIVVAAFDIIMRARKDVFGRLRRTGE